MKKYKLIMSATGSATVEARTELSAFNKGWKLEDKLRKILKENDFDGVDVLTITVQGVEEDE